MYEQSLLSRPYYKCWSFRIPLFITFLIQQPTQKSLVNGCYGYRFSLESYKSDLKAQWASRVRSEDFKIIFSYEIQVLKCIFLWFKATVGQINWFSNFIHNKIYLRGKATLATVTGKFVTVLAIFESFVMTTRIDFILEPIFFFSSFFFFILVLLK